MRKNYVVYDFTRFSLPVLLSFADNVVKCMKNNIHFPDAGEMVTDVEQATLVLRTHYQASLSGNREEAALTRQAKDVLLKLLKKLADHVDDVADGDEAIILSSGFHMAKQAEVTTRALLVVEAGEKPGTVDLRRQADPEAKSYLWEKSLDGITWEFAGVSGTTRHTITGLQSVTRYYFRVAVVTSEGTSAFSEPVSKIVE